MMSKNDQCKNCVSRGRSSFCNVPDNDLLKIDQTRALITFGARERMHVAQEDGKAGFYCIRSGHMKISFVNDYGIGTVRICGPGDLVGYNISDQSRFRVESLGSGEACFFLKEDFLQIQRQSNSITEGILNMLCLITEKKDQRISHLENYSVKSRVSALLVSLGEKFGLKSSFGIEIAVKVDRETLAKMSGTSVESLARNLTELQEDNLIKREGRKIHLLDIEKLKLYRG